MAFPLLPIVILGLTAAAWKAKKNRDDEAASVNYGVVTPERQVVYETAMNDVLEPEKILKMAEAFDKQGLPNQAELLRKRAALRTLPKEIKLQRKEIFQKAMDIKDPSKKDAIRKVAAAFHGEGAVGSAEALLRYAESL